MMVEFVSVSVPNSVTIKFKRYDANRIIKRGSYTVIVLNTTFMASQNISFFTSNFEISFSTTTSFKLFNILPANFNIPGNYLQNTKTNELCVIGLYHVRTNPTLINYLIFNATTTPIHGMNVYLQNNSTSGGYNFMTNYLIFCLSARYLAFYN